VLGGYEVRGDEQDHDVGCCQFALDVSLPVGSCRDGAVAPDVDQAGPHEWGEVDVESFPVALVHAGV
jgi:hypothetical protein